MHNFKETIKGYLSNVTDINDKRLINEALHLIDSEPIMSEQLLKTLNEIFSSLKDKYELKMVQDPESLGFMIILSKGQPIVENDHDIEPLIEELEIISYDDSITDIEQLALGLLNACKHAEENDIILLEKIMDFIDNNWTLTPLTLTNYQDSNVKASHIVPDYQKRLIKKPNNE